MIQKTIFSWKVLASHNLEKEELDVNFLVSCLTVNNSFLCTGLLDELKKIKSNFFVLAKPKFEVYQENLKFGSVYSPTTFTMPKGKIKSSDNVLCSSSMHEHARMMMDILWVLKEEENV